MYIFLFSTQKLEFNSVWPFSDNGRAMQHLNTARKLVGNAE